MPIDFPRSRQGAIRVGETKSCQHLIRIRPKFKVITITVITITVITITLFMPLSRGEAAFADNLDGLRIVDGTNGVWWCLLPIAPLAVSLRVVQVGGAGKGLSSITRC